MTGIRTGRGGSWLRVAATGLLVMTSTGCGEVARSVGQNREQAAIVIDQFLYSARVRFGPVTPTDSYQHARRRIAASALTPSRLFRDSTIWTGFDGESRDLVYGGAMTRGGYRLGLADDVDMDIPGAYRRTTRLRRLDSEIFRWSIRDELTIGSMTPEQIGGGWKAFLDQIGAGDGNALERSFRMEADSSYAVMSALLTLESLQTMDSPGGGQLATFRVALDPRRLGERYPLFGRYLRRYLDPTRINLTFEDPRGRLLAVAALASDTASISVRAADGRLAPLDGSAYQRVDTLRVKGDLRTSFGIVGVGAEEIGATAILETGPSAIWITLHFDQEPDWRFPPLVERLLRTSLARPFEADGAIFRLGITRRGNHTAFVREYELVVEESTIVRWLGSLGSSLVGDFRDGAEEEFDRFNGEILDALRVDVKNMLD